MLLSPVRCLNAVGGVCLGVSPLLLLAVYVVTVGHPSPPLSADGSVSSANTALDDQAPELLSPAYAALDPFHIICARKQFRALRHASVRLAAARTVTECRRWQRRRAMQRLCYRLTYFEITPAGRRRSHLPVPDGP